MGGTRAPQLVSTVQVIAVAIAVAELLAIQSRAQVVLLLALPLVLWCVAWWWWWRWSGLSCLVYLLSALACTCGSFSRLLFFCFPCCGRNARVAPCYMMCCSHAWRDRFSKIYRQSVAINITITINSVFCEKGGVYSSGGCARCFDGLTPVACTVR